MLRATGAIAFSEEVVCPRLPSQRECCSDKRAAASLNAAAKNDADDSALLSFALCMRADVIGTVCETNGAPCNRRFLHILPVVGFQQRNGSRRGPVANNRGEGLKFQPLRRRRATADERASAKKKTFCRVDHVGGPLVASSAGGLHRAVVVVSISSPNCFRSGRPRRSWEFGVREGVGRGERGHQTLSA